MNKTPKKGIKHYTIVKGKRIIGGEFARTKKEAATQFGEDRKRYRGKEIEVVASKQFSSVKVPPKKKKSKKKSK